MKINKDSFVPDRPILRHDGPKKKRGWETGNHANGEKKRGGEAGRRGKTLERPIYNRVRFTPLGQTRGLGKESANSTPHNSRPWWGEKNHGNGDQGTPIGAQKRGAQGKRFTLIGGAGVTRGNS